VWLWRARLGPAARFLLSFLLAGSLLLIQNLFTNLHMQSLHWFFFVPPFCGIATFLLLEKSRVNAPRLLVLAGLLLFVGALLCQTMTYRLWLASLPESPEFWLDRRMPETIAWLNAGTPAESVVLARDGVSCALPIFTHNKVYWCGGAAQYALEESEALARRTQAESWGATPLPFSYRADYYLGVGNQECRLRAGSPVYENRREATCLYAIRGAGVK